MSVVFVYFTASWCEPCKRASPVFDRLRQSFPRDTFDKVDVDGDDERIAQFDVDTVPTLVVLRKGAVVERTVPTAQTLEACVRRHAS